MNYTKLLENAIYASYAAGYEIMNIYKTNDFDISTKSDSSPVTRADIAASNSIISHLQATGIPIICEETIEISYEKRKLWNTVWIVDPIDGTKNFIKKNNEFTVNIALIENQEPTIGVVYAPAYDTLYFGTSRIGAFCVQDISKKTDDFTIDNLLKYAAQMPFVHKLAEYTIVASRYHRSADTNNFIIELQKQHKNTRIISVGSSLKICLVASGEAHIYPRFECLSEWDIAAGDAIARASGCTSVQAHTKKPLLYNKESLASEHFIISR
jgi:3'(2'), 5'-bisphosphate nucleotidase